MQEMGCWVAQSGLGDEAGRADQFLVGADEPELTEAVRRLEFVFFGKPKPEEQGRHFQERNFTGQCERQGESRVRRQDIFNKKPVGFRP